MIRFIQYVFTHNAFFLLPFFSDKLLHNYSKLLGFVDLIVRYNGTWRKIGGMKEGNYDPSYFKGNN